MSNYVSKIRATTTQGDDGIPTVHVDTLGTLDDMKIMLGDFEVYRGDGDGQAKDSLEGFAGGLSAIPLELHGVIEELNDVIAKVHTILGRATSSLDGSRGIDATALRMRVIEASTRNYLAENGEVGVWLGEGEDEDDRIEIRVVWHDGIHGGLWNPLTIERDAFQEVLAFAALPEHGRRGFWSQWAVLPGILKDMIVRFLTLEKVSEEELADDLL